MRSEATVPGPSAVGETFISRSKLRVLYVTFYLALGGISARMAVFYFVSTPASMRDAAETYGWLAMALLALFAVLSVARHWAVTGLQRNTSAYLAVQSAVVFGLLLLPPHIDLYAILYFLLSLQAMLALPRWRGYAWISLFAVLGSIGVILDHGLVNGLAQSLVFVAGYYFFGSFAAVTAEAERARREAQGLLMELGQRDEALRQSEERYRRVVEGSPDAILVFDEAGKVVDSNESACHLLGRSFEELHASSLDELFPDRDPDQERAAFAMLRQPHGPARMRLEEVLFVRDDGRQVYFDAELGVITLNGAPHLLAMARDVTDRRAAQETLFQQERDMAILEERNRMAREIHDTLAQGFTGIVVQLEAAEQALVEDVADAVRHLAMAKSQARDSLQEARRSVWNLVPRPLEDLSLADVLREEVARFNGGGRAQANLRVDGGPTELPARIQAGLLRICQEALTNVRRHAGASKVDIEFALRNDSITLKVQDDGCGFEAVADHGKQEGFGLRSMSERAQELGGKLNIESVVGSGTQVFVSLPLPQNNSAESAPR